ncbi:hypothetical protein SCFA_10005 [anaerobic digester metagenome]|uniref:Uncharacterized protein n=1 Tax=anaerobic digester metagenome TaxID=1263854 RepID=A0A485LTI3_9ZZZZ
MALGHKLPTSGIIYYLILTCPSLLAIKSQKKIEAKFMHLWNRSIIPKYWKNQCLG